MSAADLKAEGTAAFKAKDFAGAAALYEEAAKAAAPDAKQYGGAEQLFVGSLSNAAMCHLKLGAWGAALAACNAVLAVPGQEGHVKALFRRGQALAGRAADGGAADAAALGETRRALHAAAKAAPQDKQVRAAFDAAKAKHEAAKAAEQAAAAKAAADVRRQAEEAGGAKEKGAPEVLKPKTLKQEGQLLEEFDGSRDRDLLALYHHARDNGETNFSAICAADLCCSCWSVWFFRSLRELERPADIFAVRLQPSTRSTGPSTTARCWTTTLKGWR